MTGHRRSIVGAAALALCLGCATAAQAARLPTPPRGATATAPAPSRAEVRGTAAALARSVDFHAVPRDAYEAGKVIVKFRDETRDAARDAALAPLTSAAPVPLNGVGASVVTLDAGLRVPDVVDRLNARDDVLYAEPSYVREIFADPNDPRYPVQYALPRIGAPTAWQWGSGDPTQPVAVLDTGFEADHPDLGLGAFAGMVDAVNDDGYPEPALDRFGAPSDHGTHVAGIIAARANNGIGIAGVAPSTKLVALRVFADRGGATESAIDRALQHVDYIGARIVNMSYGWGPDASDSYNVPSATEYMQIASRAARGVLFVIAAGNENTNLGLTDKNVYPCSYSAPNIVCVAATGSSDYRWFDAGDAASNYDATATGDVDIAAPGEDIQSTVPGRTYALNSGTSMAAPHVAGAAAIALGMRPNMTVDDLRWLILQCADQIPQLVWYVPQGRRLNVSCMTNLLATYPSWRAGPGPHPFVFKNGRWSTRYDYKGGIESFAFAFGAAGDTPLMGDWDGDGIKTPGVRRGATFMLSNEISTAPTIARSFDYGYWNDKPIVGDWNGDGKDEVGIRRGAEYHLRTNTEAGGGTLTWFQYGDPSMREIVGDWNGDGVDTVSVESNGTFYIHNSNTTGVGDYGFAYGSAGMTPVVGDWDRDSDGNRSDTIGMWWNGTFLLRNSNSAGGYDIRFDFGPADGTPLFGG